MISYQNLSAYLAKPQKDCKVALIVLSEWWGITDNLKLLADRFAAGSYDSQLGNNQAYALCPDLYHGKQAPYSNPDEAKHLMDNLNFPNAIQEVQTWIDYLKKEYKVERVGVLGFCMGGALSLACASKLTIQAAAPFYGIPPSQYFPPKNIKCPLLLTFGQDDDSKGFSSPSDVKTLTDQLSCKYEVNMVQGAEHAFMNEARPEVYRPTQARAAFDKALTFLVSELKY